MLKGRLMKRRQLCKASVLVPLGLTQLSAAVSKPPIRIGQIGTKHAHASGKIAAIRKLNTEFELVGVVESDREQRGRVADSGAYAGVSWVSERELLENQDVQAVAIETAVPELVPTARRAVAAGKHLHLDKPGGPSLHEFRLLLKEAKDRKRIVQLGYMLRYNPAFQFMYRAVADHWLGEIMEVDAMIGKMASPSLRAEIGWHPGGGMFELGCHVIDSIVYMLGRPSRVVPFSRRTQVDGVSDNQLAVLEYEKATATVRCNHRDPFGFPRRRFQISGDEGSIEIKPLESGKLTLMLTRACGDFSKGVHELDLARQGGRYDQEFVDLAHCIRREAKFAWTKEHDAATHETLLLASGSH